MNDKIATFAMGCFWGPDDFFSKLPGVIETTVGYTGGDKVNPTYHELDDHTESIKISFDPAQISYDDLLAYFWDQHNPTYPAKTQYKSVIFYHEEEQRKLAETTKIAAQATYEMQIVTEILPAEEFYPAEDYHQKYLEKNRGAVC